MTTLHISVSCPVLSSLYGDLSSKRSCHGLIRLPHINRCSLPRRKVGFLRRNGYKMRISAEKWSFSVEGLEKEGVLMRKERRGSLVVVRAKQGFDFNGGGGGGWGNGNTARVLGNLALAIGFTYFSVTGQLGWILDAIVSIWLLAVLLPIVGLGAFFWFAGRDIVQDSCPNCGNDFQIFKSSLKDCVQLCPFCTQPFSVQDDKFVRESARFSSDRSTTFGEVFNGFSRRSEKGKGSSATVVDIEAEVKDID